MRLQTWFDSIACLVEGAIGDFGVSKQWWYAYLKLRKCTSNIIRGNWFAPRSLFANKSCFETPNLLSYPLYCLFISRSRHRTTNFPNSESRIFTTKFLFWFFLWFWEHILRLLWDLERIRKGCVISIYKLQSVSPYCWSSK